MPDGARLGMLGVALCLSACAWQPETIVEESVQQAAQVVDTGQTLDLRHTGHCTYGPKSEEFTGSAWRGTLRQVRPYLCTPPDQEVMAASIIGKHPSDAQVYEFKLAEMALHAGVTELLVAKGWRRAARAWELVTIGVQGGVDGWNASTGLKIRF